MKRTKAILLSFTCALGLILNGCKSSSPTSNSLSFDNPPAFVTENSGNEKASSAPQSFVDEFEKFGQREADYSIATEQIVRTGETLNDLKITDFKSEVADTSSKASVEILSAEFVDDANAYKPFLSEPANITECKLALVKIKVTNTGDKEADFVCDTRVYRVNKEKPVVSFADDSLFSGLAYYVSNPQKELYGSTVRLTPNETIEIMLGYFIPQNLITQDTVFYYELNPHEDSFFYDTGRKEVYFVEIKP